MPGLMLDAANDWLARAMAKAQQDFGRPICVAVCDALLKDDKGALLGAIGISGLTSAEDQIISDHIAEHVRSKGMEIAR